MNSVSMDNHSSKNAGFVLGTSFLTIVVGSLVFLVALSWNDLAQLTFERKKCEQEGEIDAAFKYAFIITIVAILTVFLVLYYVPGNKL